MKAPSNAGTATDVAHIKRVLVADDHPVYRDGISRIVATVCPGATCVHASTHDQVLTLTQGDAWFDLIFIDLVMPGAEGFDALGILRRRAPTVPTIVVSFRKDALTIRQAMVYGVSGYIPKTSSPETIEAALRQVLAGGIYLPEDVSSENETSAALGTLTARQYDVLERLAEGRSNRQIATDLGIEEITVKMHMSAILRRLGVKNRVQAAVASRAYLQSLVDR